MNRLLLFTALVALCAGACSPKLPPRWNQGGAPLVIPTAAHWDRGEADAVDIKADGKVFVDGDLKFVLDRVGRITDEDYEPLAVLLPDGHVVASDHRVLGRIGVTNASPPDRGTAWLALMPNGQVVYFDDDGSRSIGGVWRGCQGPGLRACTLVTHLVILEHYLTHARSTNVSIGVGIGF